MPSIWQQTRTKRRNRALDIIRTLPLTWVSFDRIVTMVGLGTRQTAYYLTVAKRLGLVEPKRTSYRGIKSFKWRRRCCDEEEKTVV